MHELSIMQSVMETVLAEADANGARQILAIGMKIGALTNVVPEAIEFAFDVLTKGTKAEGAHLKVEYLLTKSSCEECHFEFEVDNYSYLCPKCSSGRTKVIQGTELQLSFLEIE